MRSIPTDTYLGENNWIDVGIQSFMNKEDLIAIKLQLNQLRLITAN